jgi:protein-L-isoaspartate(D-aspartate) O-methyltransferase
MDFAHARDMMVDGQVRTADVTDDRIIHAMRTLPRERFTPASKRQLAYADLDIEVAPGRSLLRPRDFAKLVSALAPRAEDRAIELMGASGYGAAVLSRCCASVVAHDPDPELSLAARSAFEAIGLGNVKTVTGPALDGWADDAPYDLILVNGGVEVAPDAWLTQLAANGRLGVIVREGASGSARIYTRTGDVFAYRIAFDAAPAVAPGLGKSPSFAF